MTRGTDVAEGWPISSLTTVYPSSCLRRTQDPLFYQKKDYEPWFNNVVAVNNTGGDLLQGILRIVKRSNGSIDQDDPLRDVTFFDVWDGQQRLVMFCILLGAMRDTFRDHPDKEKYSDQLHTIKKLLTCQSTCGAVVARVWQPASRGTFLKATILGEEQTRVSTEEDEKNESCFFIFQTQADRNEDAEDEKLARSSGESNKDQGHSIRNFGRCFDDYLRRRTS